MNAFCLIVSNPKLFFRSCLVYVMVLVHASGFEPETFAM